MRNRLAYIYRTKHLQAPTISILPFYALANNDPSIMNNSNISVLERTEIIEHKMSKVSQFIEAGIKILDMIDGYLSDEEKINSLHETYNNNINHNSVTNLSTGRRSSILSTASSISLNTNSNTNNSIKMAKNDPLSAYTKWVNLWNRQV